MSITVYYRLNKLPSGKWAWEYGPADKPLSVEKELSSEEVKEVIEELLKLNPHSAELFPLDLWGAKLSVKPEQLAMTQDYFAMCLDGTEE